MHRKVAEKSIRRIYLHQTAENFRGNLFTSNEREREREGHSEIQNFHLHRQQ